VHLTVDVLNRGPLDQIAGTSVAFYAGTPENGRLIGRAQVPEDTAIGQTRTVSQVWDTAQFSGTHVVTVQAEDLFGHPTFFETQATSPPVEVVASGDDGGPEVAIAALENRLILVQIRDVGQFRAEPALVLLGDVADRARQLELAEVAAEGDLLLIRQGLPGKD